MTRLRLRGYQTIDVARALTEFHGRVFLRHEVGTGKTLMATRITEGCWPCVVICRSYLVLQWVRHIRSEYPDARIGSVVEELPNGRWRELSRVAKVAMLTEKPGYDFYVLTFATPRRTKKSASASNSSDSHAAGSRTVREIWRDVAEEHGWTASKRGSGRGGEGGEGGGSQRLDGRIRAAPFEYPLPPCRSLIVDESSTYRGRDSQQYAGAYQLAVSTKQRKAAERVVLLSATPAWREQDDLYTQLRLLDPHTFRSYWAFVDRFCQVEETDFGSKVVGGRTRRIARLLEKYAIIRDYTDPEVAIAVPKVIEKEVWSWLSPGGAQAYSRLEAKLSRDRLAGYGVGSGVSDFSRITAHDKNKLDALDELIGSIDGPYALFAWYQDTIELLSRHFELPFFTGKSNSAGANRYTRSEAIRTSGSFVASIGCVQEGVDLSHLRTLILYEVPYTYGAMHQLRGRFARWRQDNSTDPVQCYVVLCAGTVDEQAYEASQNRGATEREILDEIKRAAAPAPTKPGATAASATHR